MYILADIKRIVEIQDLYRNKDEFLFFQIQKSLFFNVKESLFNKHICEICILADIK